MFKKIKKIQCSETGVLEDIRRPEEKEKDYQAEEIIAFGPVNWKEKPESEWRKFPIFDQSISMSCFPPNTPVLMEDLSYKSITNIQVGERVFTHTGQIKKVTHTFQRKWQGLRIKIIPFGFGEGIISTPEHPYLVLEKGLKNIIYKWKQAKDIKVGDYLVMPIIRGVKDKTLYWYERDEDFLWLLGIYLAEGSIYETRITFTISKKEQDLKEKIVEKLKKIGINNIGLYEKRGSDTLNIVFANTLWCKVFEELGGKLAQNKKINNRLMWLDPKLQMKIFEGWNEGDGWKGKKGEVITTISPYLANQFRIILMRNNIIPFLQTSEEYVDKNNVKHQKVYRLNIYSNHREKYARIVEDNILLAVRKIEYPKYIAKTPARRKSKKDGSIKEYDRYVVPKGGYVYNLEVEGDESYIVYGFAVHNCVAQSVAKCLGINNFLEEKEFIFLSARDIYTRRVNKGSGGMSGVDACNIAVKYGATLESLMPSQGFSETPMNKDLDRTPSKELVGKIYKAKNWVGLPCDIEKIAFVIERGFGVMVFLRWDHDEWSRTSPTINPKSKKSCTHACVCTDYLLWEGKKHLLIEDSWGEKTAMEGRRLVSEEWFRPENRRVAWISYFVDLCNLEIFNPKIKLEIEKPKLRLTKDLKVGSKGFDIAQLQRALGYLKDNEGYLFPLVQAPTGYFGGITHNAVRRFQSLYNLEIDGMVGAKTREKLNEIFK